MIDSTPYKSLQKQLDSIHDAMYETPGNFYIKDLQGRYIYLNRNTQMHAGCSLAGKTDFDAPWVDFAVWYRTCDSNAIEKNRCVQSKELLKNHQKKVIPVSTHKKPFYHKGKLIGSCGVTVEIPSSSLNGQVTLSEKTVFFDINSNEELSLAARHREILYWILQGSSAKEAAIRVGISFRTVEHHLSTIKDVNEYGSLKEILLSVRAV